MKWAVQGKALIGELRLADGGKGKALVMGPRSRPKGAQILQPKAGAAGEFDAAPLHDVLALLEPGAVIDVLCMQERVFGDTGLEAPPQLKIES